MRSLNWTPAMFLALALALAASATGQAPVDAAFSGHNGVIAFVTDRDANEEIYVIEPDGTGLVNLTNDPRSDRQPAWSRSGRRIVFQRDGEIWTMNADGSGQTDLGVAGDSPAWSPNGGRIVFGRDSDIWAVDVDGSNEVQLTDDPGFDGFPAWSPDGSRILFDSDRAADNRDIWVMDTDGTNLTNLTPVSGTQVFGDWSPDGAMIVYQSGAPFGVNVMNADGSKQVQIVNDDGFDGEPGWSPEGDQIVFGTDRDANEEIYTATKGGGQETNLTNNPARDREAAWQPIIFAGDADCDDDLDAVDGLQVLREVAGLPAADCVDAGNVDCDKDIDAVDALHILRYVADLKVNLPPGCPPLSA